MEHLHIYARVSTDKQAKYGYSLDTQISKGKELAKKLGMSYKIYEDKGISGTSKNLNKRPAFSKLFTGIESGIVKNVYIYDENRAARNSSVGMMLMSICEEQKVNLYFDKEKVDFTDPMMVFMVKLKLVWAEQESLIKGKSIKDNLYKAAEAGRWIGVFYPYGYKKKKDRSMMIDAKEAKIVKEIYKMSLNGVGAHSIAKDLNHRGIMTRLNKMGKDRIEKKNKYTGKTEYVDTQLVSWNSNTILGILKNSLYKGDRYFQKKRYDFPQIINRKLWEDVYDNLTRNKNQGINHNRYQYILKGKLFCSRCGQVLIGRSKPVKSHIANLNMDEIENLSNVGSIKYNENFYMCMGKRLKPNHSKCDLPSINIWKADELIWNSLKTCFLTPNKLLEGYESRYSPAAIKKQIPKLKSKIGSFNKKIEKLEEKKGKLLNILIDGIIDDHVFKKKRDEIEMSIIEIRESIDPISVEIANLNNAKVSANWLTDSIRKISKQFALDLPVKEKQKIIQQWIKDIIIDYDKALGVHSLRITYKTPIVSFGPRNSVLDEVVYYPAIDDYPSFTMDERKEIGAKYKNMSGL